MKIYVGNLSYDATEDQLRQMFEEYGEITSVNIITDRDTGRSKGFGFLEMTDQGQATAAIEGLNGQDLNGRTLNVNEARPRNDNRSGGGGGGGRRRNW